MNSFKLGFNEVSESGVRKEFNIKPYTIVECTFGGFQYNIIESKKDSSKYEVLDIIFNMGGEATIQKRFFGPSDKSFVERKENKNNPDREFPSQWEVIQRTVEHVIAVLSPKHYESYKSQIGSKKNSTSTFESYAAYISKLTAKLVGTKLYLKLGANNSGYAEPLVSVVVYEKGGQSFLGSNFLSQNEDLSFTKYELKLKERFQKSRPTSAKDLASKELSDLDEINDLDDNDDDDLSKLDDGDLPF